METSRQAERAAALKAVEVLHKNGLLDKHLLPTIKADEDSGSMDMAELKKSCPNAGTDRRRDTYKRHVSQHLSLHAISGMLYDGGCLSCSDPRDPLCLSPLRR